MKHYRYGGSTIARTFGCAGWRFLADKLPHSDTSSDAAKLGTALHTAMENYLVNGDRIKVGDTLEGVTFTADHVAEKFIPAVKAVEEVMDAYGIDEVLPEHMAHISDDVGGSMDLLGAGDDWVMMLDFKFGDGFMVEAEGNKQLMFYAAMAALADTPAAEMFQGDKKLVLVILQPTPRKEDVYTTWETTMEELDAFIEEMYDALEHSRAQNDKNLITTAGPWCTFCPSMAICPTKTGVAARAERIDATAPELIPVLNEALEMADQLEEWIKAVRKTAYEQANKGVAFTNYKLVDKRASRKWVTPEKIKAEVIAKTSKLKVSECYPATLLSPAQMQKLCKLKGVDFTKFDEYITTSSSGTTLAKRDDKRPEAIPLDALYALAKRL